VRGDNPFRPGSGLEPPYFAGRGAETGEFARLLRRLKAGKAENAVVCGLRGVGKTVLLRRFSRMCGSGGFLPVICSRYGSRGGPAAFMDAFRRDVERAGGNTGSADRPKPGGVGVPGAAARGPWHDRRSSAPLDAQIESCVRQSLERAQKSGIAGIVSTVDEFRAAKYGAEQSGVLGSLIGAFSGLQQEGLPVSLILCGLPAVAAEAGSARSYSERMFGYMEVSNLGPDAAKSAILEPLGRTSRSFSDEAVAAVVRDTGGCTYFIQFFASEIVERVDARHVKLEDYGRVRQSIIEKLRGDFFLQRTAPMSETRKTVLVEIASAKGGACFRRSAKKRARAGAPSPAT